MTTEALPSFQVQLNVIAISTLVAGLITFVAWKFGYYQILNAPDPNSSSLSWKRSLGAFVVYLGVQVLIVPFLYACWLLIQGEDITNLEHYKQTAIERGWIGIFSVIITGIALIAYYLRLVPNDREKVVGTRFTQAPVRNVFLGYLSWFIAFPWVVVVNRLISFAFDYWHIETNVDQVAVRGLKESMADPALFWTSVIFIVAIIPVFEELLFRGFLQSWLKGLFGVGIAIPITAFIFALFHFASSQKAENIELILSLFILACYLGFLRERQQSLIAPIALHSTFNLLSIMMIIASAE